MLWESFTWPALAPTQVLMLSTSRNRMAIPPWDGEYGWSKCSDHKDRNTGHRLGGLNLFERNLAAKRREKFADNAIFYLPLRIDEGQPTGPPNSMIAAARRCCSKTWNAFDIDLRVPRNGTNAKRQEMARGSTYPPQPVSVVRRKVICESVSAIC